MATLKFIVEIEDVELSKEMIKEGFIEMLPMPKIDDPDWIDEEDGTAAPKIDMFSSVRQLISCEAGKWIIRVANKGLKRKAKKAVQLVSENVIVKE